jgi:hypothetical protein
MQMPVVRRAGRKKFRESSGVLKVGFYPFREPDASFTLFQRTTTDDLPDQVVPWSILVESSFVAAEPAGQPSTVASRKSSSVLSAQ